MAYQIVAANCTAVLGFDAVWAITVWSTPAGIRKYYSYVNNDDALATGSNVPMSQDAMVRPMTYVICLDSE